jgi:hypothetical protein
MERWAAAAADELARSRWTSRALGKSADSRASRGWDPGRTHRPPRAPRGRRPRWSRRAPTQDAHAQGARAGSCTGAGRDWVRRNVRRCLHCCSSEDYRQVERGFGPSSSATAPSAVICYDFFHIAHRLKDAPQQAAHSRPSGERDQGQPLPFPSGVARPVQPPSTAAPVRRGSGTPAPCQTRSWFDTARHFKRTTWSACWSRRFTSRPPCAEQGPPMPKYRPARLYCEEITTMWHSEERFQMQGLIRLNAKRLN